MFYNLHIPIKYHKIGPCVVKNRLFSENPKDKSTKKHNTVIKYGSKSEKRKTQYIVYCSRAVKGT